MKYVYMYCLNMKKELIVRKFKNVYNNEENAFIIECGNDYWTTIKSHDILSVKTNIDEILKSKIAILEGRLGRMYVDGKIDTEIGAREIAFNEVEKARVKIKEAESYVIRKNRELDQAIRSQRAANDALTNCQAALEKCLEKLKEFD